MITRPVPTPKSPLLETQEMLAQLCKDIEHARAELEMLRVAQLELRADADKFRHELDLLSARGTGKRSR